MMSRLAESDRLSWGGTTALLASGAGAEAAALALTDRADRDRVGALLRLVGAAGRCMRARVRGSVSSRGAVASGEWTRPAAVTAAMVSGFAWHLLGEHRRCERAGGLHSAGPGSPLLVPERLHRIHSSGPVGREQAEHQPDRDAHPAGQHDAPERHRGLQAQRRLEQLAGPEARRRSRAPPRAASGWRPPPGTARGSRAGWRRAPFGGRSPGSGR